MSSPASRVSSFIARLRSSRTGSPSLRPLWIVAAVGVAFAANELRSRSRTPDPAVAPAPPSPALEELGKAPCPPNTLPDHGVCIPVPARGAAAADVTDNALGLLPGRPSDYGRYLSPIVNHAPAANASGGAVVTAAAGSEIRALRLEAQIGATRWASLPGAEPLLVTLHRVQRGGSIRSYVLVYRGAEFTAPPTWTEVVDGGVIGRVAGAGRPPALRLTVRQLRRGTQGDVALDERLLRDSNSLECDPRNVLPLSPA